MAPSPGSQPRPIGGGFLSSGAAEQKIKSAGIMEGGGGVMRRKWDLQAGAELKAGGAAPNPPHQVARHQAGRMEHLAIELQAVRAARIERVADRRSAALGLA